MTVARRAWKIFISKLEHVLPYHSHANYCIIQVQTTASAKSILPIGKEML